jgi:hypothetical protein
VRSAVEVLFTVKKQPPNFDRKWQVSVKSSAYNMVTISQDINNEPISTLDDRTFLHVHQVCLYLVTPLH